MSEDCPICRIIRDESIEKIYSDEYVVAMLARKGVAKGEVVVMPVEHYPIIEMIPDWVMARIGEVVNDLSKAVFDATNAEGTNILINNGVAAGQKWAHAMVRIIPRHSNDGLDFSWKTKQLSEEEMSTVELSLKEAAAGIGNFMESEEKGPLKLDKEPAELTKSESEKKKKNDLEGEKIVGERTTDYRMRQLYRTP